ncbi:MAG: hypothetical protein U0271_16190 [Polyangiaceae bacterium]
MSSRRKKSTPKAPPRARTVERANTRAHEKLVETVVKLDALEVGGSPERPIEVTSASEVEVTAESKPCPVCGDSLRAVEHDVIEHEGARLRRVRVVCRMCHARWERFFRLGPRFS